MDEGIVAIFPEKRCKDDKELVGKKCFTRCNTEKGQVRDPETNRCYKRGTEAQERKRKERQAENKLKRILREQDRARRLLDPDWESITDLINPRKTQKKTRAPNQQKVGVNENNPVIQPTGLLDNLIGVEAPKTPGQKKTRAPNQQNLGRKTVKAVPEQRAPVPQNKTRVPASRNRQQTRKVQRDLSIPRTRNQDKTKRYVLSKIQRAGPGQPPCRSNQWYDHGFCYSLCPDDKMYVNGSCYSQKSYDKLRTKCKPNAVNIKKKCLQVCPDDTVLYRGKCHTSDNFVIAKKKDISVLNPNLGAVQNAPPPPPQARIKDIALQKTLNILKTIRPLPPPQASKTAKAPQKKAPRKKEPSDCDSEKEDFVNGKCFAKCPPFFVRDANNRCKTPMPKKNWEIWKKGTAVDSFGICAPDEDLWENDIENKCLKKCRPGYGRDIPNNIPWCIPMGKKRTKKTRKPKISSKDQAENLQSLTKEYPLFKYSTIEVTHDNEIIITKDDVGKYITANGMQYYLLDKIDSDGTRYIEVEDEIFRMPRKKFFEQDETNQLETPEVRLVKLDKTKDKKIIIREDDSGQYIMANGKRFYVKDDDENGTQKYAIINGEEISLPGEYHFVKDEKNPSKLFTEDVQDLQSLPNDDSPTLHYGTIEKTRDGKIIITKNHDGKYIIADGVKIDVLDYMNRDGKRYVQFGDKILRIPGKDFFEQDEKNPVQSPIVDFIDLEKNSDDKIIIRQDYSGQYIMANGKRFYVKDDDENGTQKNAIINGEEIPLPEEYIIKRDEEIPDTEENSDGEEVVPMHEEPMREGRVQGGNLSIARHRQWWT
jgi:hypothetical protein